MLTIKGHRVEKLICQTRLSSVYLARHLESGTSRVVKFRELSQARAEFEFTASVAAPNIVKVFEFSEFDGPKSNDMIQLFGRKTLGYFTMEYIEGQTLGQLAAVRPFSPVQAVSIMLKVSKALLPLWLNGKVHADIKPGNIILRTGSGPVVIDFGIGSDYAYGLQPKIEGKPFYGTLAFGAPERSYSGAVPHPSWDMFSIGLSTYYLTTGINVTDWLKTQGIDSSAPSSAVLRRFNPLLYFDNKRVPMQLIQFLGMVCHQDPGLRLADPTRFIRKLEALQQDLTA